VGLASYPLTSPFIRNHTGEIMTLIRKAMLATLILPMVSCSDLKSNETTSSSNLLANADYPVRSFSCESRDDNQPYDIETIDLEIINSYEASLTFPDLGEVNNMGIFRVDYDYKPRTEETKKYERTFKVGTARLDFPESTPEFYIEKDLFEGGRHRGNGVYGGVIRTKGSGYYWAEYMCRGRRPTADASIVCEQSGEKYRYNKIDRDEQNIFFDSCWQEIQSGDICYEGSLKQATDLMVDIANEDIFGEEVIADIEKKTRSFRYSIYDAHVDRPIVTYEVTACRN
jgi:hypothetical protein